MSGQELPHTGAPAGPAALLYVAIGGGITLFSVLVLGASKVRDAARRIPNR